jgi:hypothetical protein
MDERYKKLFLNILTLESKIVSKDETVFDDIRYINDFKPTDGDREMGLYYDVETIKNAIENAYCKLRDSREVDTKFFDEVYNALTIPGKDILKDRLRLKSNDYIVVKQAMDDILARTEPYDGTTAMEEHMLYSQIISVAIGMRDSDMIEKTIKKIESIR